MIKKLGVIFVFLTVFLSNTINYFYAYLYLGDNMMQWQIAIKSIAIVHFIFALTFLINEVKGKKDITVIILSGWLTVFFAINLVGTFLGYSLHTKAFMLSLLLICVAGIVHYGIKKWVK